jgi:hypothetical protein
MKRLLIALCAIGAFTVPALALPDYGDRDAYSCNAKKSNLTLSAFSIKWQRE